MVLVDTIVNAAFIGIGSGIGSYFGTKVARESEEHFKRIFRGEKNGERKL